MKILLLVGALGLQHANGHGHMYNPTPWHATNDCSSPIPGDCHFGLKVPYNNCTGSCSSSAGSTAFFSNYTMIPSGMSATLPEEMFDFPEWRRHTWKQDGETWTKVGLNPWNAPGSAPIWSNGCGTNGGNPYGCLQGDDIPGRCCGHNCGGYSGGKSATSHYRDGLFGTPKETKWTRGEPAEVYWTSNAYHRGGYAYRLCKVEQKEYWKVTEQCFQRGHLNFSGKTTWIYLNPWNNPADGWTTKELITTRTGTTPEGSEWAKINLPKKPSTNDKWAFKDLVEVPETLESGDYVLSFRWDCLESPQIWNA